MLGRLRTTALAGETSTGYMLMIYDICCSVLSMVARCEVWGAGEEGRVCTVCCGGESGNILED